MASSPSPSLARHLRALYPLARVLAGADEADVLVRRVYEHAASIPPQERPSNEQGWLFRLMIEAREAPSESTEVEAAVEEETSFTDDPFRREVADHTAKRMLPVAFAACSRHERSILAIDVLTDNSDEVLASTLDTTVSDAQSVRDRARSALRASLRDVLSGPERMLVDVALPDDALRSHLRSLLTDRFQPAPAAVRSTVTELLERAGPHGPSASEDGPAPSWGGRAQAALSRVASPKGLGGLLLIALLVAGGLGGASYFFSSADPAPRSVIERSVQQASSLQAIHSTDAPADAATYIRDTWNRHVSVPSIEGAPLDGVAHVPIGNDAEVPALLYRDEESGDQIVTYVYNYALLDRLGDQTTLDRSLRTKLAANESLLSQQHENRAVVLWRQRANIFLVVAPNADEEALRARIAL